MLRRLLTTAVVTGAVVVAPAASAFAVGPAEDTIAATPAYDCGPPVGPPAHCVNTRSRGTVVQVLVFDGRGPAEGITTDPKFADVPCPHDAGATEGTWWQPPGPDGEPLPLWVCHHRPTGD